MFKYQESSDLLDGSLVTPLRAEEDGTVLCLCEDGTKKYYSFEDFDFSKKPEDRKPKEPESEPETKPSEEVIAPTIKDVIEEMEKDVDDSEYDGTDDDTEIKPEDPDVPWPEISKEGFLSKEESAALINSIDIVDKKYNYLVWRDSIDGNTKSIVDKIKDCSFKDEQGSIYTFNNNATSVSMTYSAGIANFNVSFNEKESIITLVPVEYIYSNKPIDYKYKQIVGGFLLTRNHKVEGYPPSINLEKIIGENK